MCTVSEEPVVVAPEPLGPRPGLPTGSAAPLGTSLETSVAFRAAKERHFRGAKGDDATVMNSRPRKDTLLPEVARMALEGCSGAAIGRELGLPERTVNHWLREVRQEWKANAAEGAAEALGIAQARLVTAYREAMEAWRESRQEIRTKTVVECEGTGDRNRGRTTKTTLRTESPRANAALLGKAIDAAKALYLLADGSSAARGQDYRARRRACRTGGHGP